MFKNFLVFTILFIALIVLPSKASAYLDPGTGSLLVQVIIAAFATILITIKMFWGKIKNYFHFSRHDDDKRQE